MKKPRKRKETQEEQSARFIEAAREAGASEDEAVFDETVRRLATANPQKSGKSKG